MRQAGGCKINPGQPYHLCLCSLCVGPVLMMQVPPGCSRYSISIKKPLGIVLEQNKDTGVITIAEISPEGNAAKTGLVAVVSGGQAAPGLSVAGARSTTCDAAVRIAHCLCKQHPQCSDRRQGWWLNPPKLGCAVSECHASGCACRGTS